MKKKVPNASENKQKWQVIMDPIFGSTPSHMDYFASIREDISFVGKSIGILGLALGNSAYQTIGLSHMQQLEADQDT